MSFLRDFCFPDSGDAARAEMWCPYMLCNVVCAKCYDPTL